MNYFTLLSICSLFALTPLFAQQPDLEDLNTEAYLSMLDADNLLDQGKEAEALPLYRQALQEYEELKTRDPDFKTTIVEYRIEILTEKIDTLRKTLPAQARAQPLPAEATVAPQQDNYESLYLETREKMLRDAARLLELERRNIEMVVTLRENQQTLNQQQAHLRELRKQLSDNEAEQQGSTAALQKEVQDLNRFNTLLQERADTMEGTNRDLTAERDEMRVTIRERNRQLSELEENFQETQKELAEEKRNANQNEQRLILSRNQLRDDLEETKRELETARMAEAQAAEKVAGVALLEETVIELNKRNEQQAAQLREASEQISTLLQERNAREEERAVLLAQHEATRAELQALTDEKAEWGEAVKPTRSMIRNLHTAQSELAEIKKENAKLRLNFQQEQAVRSQLQSTVELQLKTITQRMNEIIGLRREIAELKMMTASATEVEEPLKED